jgi:hypothetical protein
MERSFEHHARRSKLQPSTPRILMVNVKQYFVNKFSRVLISVIQGRKLFATFIGDMGIL